MNSRKALCAMLFGLFLSAFGITFLDKPIQFLTLFLIFAIAAY